MENLSEAALLFLEASQEEQRGNLGRAIELYARAFRMDPGVQERVSVIVLKEDNDSLIGSSNLIQPVNPELHELLPLVPLTASWSGCIPPMVVDGVALCLGMQSLHSLERLAQLNARFYQICRAEKLWRHLYRHYFPQTCPLNAPPIRLQFVFTPRLRPDGFYACRIRYFRPGAHEGIDAVSLLKPIHLVTYYRILRFWTGESVAVMALSTERPSQSLADSIKSIPPPELHPKKKHDSLEVFYGHVQVQDRDSTTTSWCIYFENGMEMTFHSAVHQLPLNTDPAKRPSSSLECTWYGSDHVTIDVSDWPRFYFYRIKSLSW